MTYSVGQKVRGSQVGGVYVASTSGNLPGGHTGQLAYVTDTQLMYVYNGSAWVAFMSAGDATTVHEAEYTASALQTIPTGTDRPLGFDTTVYSTADVTVGTSTGGSIANAKFTLNRGGLWAISAEVRWAAPNSGSQYGIWCGPDNGTTRYSSQFHNAGGTAAFDCSLSFVRRFTSSSTLNVYAFQNSGGNEDTAVLNAGNRINLSWLRS